MNKTETVPTSQLQKNDLVLTHGMRVRLDAPIPTYRDGVVAWSGIVTNYADVIAEGHIPASFIRDARWTIQGNDLAHWTRVTPASQVVHTTETER